MRNRQRQVILDPRITSQDLDDDLRIVIGEAEIGGSPLIIAARVNFLTIEVGEADGPLILWVPYPKLFSAVSELSKKAGC